MNHEADGKNQSEASQGLPSVHSVDFTLLTLCSSAPLSRASRYLGRLLREQSLTFNTEGSRGELRDLCATDFYSKAKHFVQIVFTHQTFIEKIHFPKVQG